MATKKDRDLARMDDVELLAAVPDDEWAFPEFYRRHFFDLAGWMYRRTGDAEAAHALGDAHSDVFNCGVAVSPPSDFYYYGESGCKAVEGLSSSQMLFVFADTAYSERYLGLASENQNVGAYDVSI